ncbi:MAG TPA: hypothetical protein VGM90_27665 [Kofleriaceae bacterium]|jgi:hypothetical protein
MSRRFAWAAAAVLFIAAPAFASPKSDVSAKTKEAMENYDSMDYSAARKQLDAALAVAKKGKLEKDPVTAKVYVDIGIAAFADGDAAAAKTAFVSAVKIDPKIQIDVAYKSPDLTKLLDEARAEAKGGGKQEPDVDAGGDDSVDCAGVKGLQHTIIDTAPAGGPLAIEAMVGGDISPSKVVVAYRAGGATDFTTKELTKKGECKYTGAIPATAMKGDLVHYYVAALGDNGKPMAAKGSSGSPNIIEIEGKVAGGAAPTPSDDEDPITGGGKKAAPKETATKDDTTDGGDVSGNATITGQKRPKVMFTVSAGTGFGYVSGTTEGGNKVEQCCVGNSYVVLLPEISYQVSTQLSIGVAGRIGIPVGANVNAKGAAGHSSIAPGGLLRVRYAVSKSGEGIRVMGQIGGGVMRNTIHVQTPDPGMDTDIVTQGPLLVGAGVGYIKRLGGNFSFVADFSALLGIAVVSKIGTTAPNTGVGADLSLGLAVGF